MNKKVTRPHREEGIISMRKVVCRFGVSLRPCGNREGVLET